MMKARCRRGPTLLAYAIAIGGLTATSVAAPKQWRVCTTVEEARQAARIAFEMQGEYVGTVDGDEDRKMGVHVLSLGNGLFQAVVYPGGLPGAGWDTKHKSLCFGSLTDESVELVPETGRTPRGKPKELGTRRSDEFLAVERFPPPGQRSYRGAVADGVVRLRADDGTSIVARRTERASPTLGAAPPAGAVVLLPYNAGQVPSLDAWKFGGDIPWQTDGADGGMKVVSLRAQRIANDAVTKERIQPGYRMHIEFRTIWHPDWPPMGSNSGVFPPGTPEIQILHSFGREDDGCGCGGFYPNRPPKVNMCLPPLVWQTLDVTVTAASRDSQRRVIEPARATVHYNGVLVHEGVEVKGGAGNMKLQDHTESGIAYRNIWYLPLDNTENNATPSR